MWIKNVSSYSKDLHIWFRLWPVRTVFGAANLNLGNLWVTKGETGVKKNLLTLTMSLEEAEKERNCGDGHSLSFPIWRAKSIPWVVLCPLGACWEFPDWLSRLERASELLQHAKVGNRNVSMALVCWRSDPATQTFWCSILPLQSRKWDWRLVPFFVRLLGREEGSVIPEHERPMSFSSTGTELDPREEMCSWIYEEQS